MKLFNTKTGRVMEGTELMLKSLRAKGWIELKDEIEADVNNEVVELPDAPEPNVIHPEIDEAEAELLSEEDNLFPEDEEIKKPKATPVKKGSKTKNKNK